MHLFPNFRWQKIFTSRLVAAIKRYGNYYFLTFVLIMIFLFLGKIFSDLYAIRKFKKKTTWHFACYVNFSFCIWSRSSLIVLPYFLIQIRCFKWGSIQKSRVLITWIYITTPMPKFLLTWSCLELKETVTFLDLHCFFSRECALSVLLRTNKSASK